MMGTYAAGIDLEDCDWIEADKMNMHEMYKDIVTSGSLVQIFVGMNRMFSNRNYSAGQ